MIPIFHSCPEPVTFYSHISMYLSHSIASFQTLVFVPLVFIMAATRHHPSALPFHTFPHKPGTHVSLRYFVRSNFPAYITYTGPTRTRPLETLVHSGSSYVVHDGQVKATSATARCRLLIIISSVEIAARFVPSRRRKNRSPHPYT